MTLLQELSSDIGNLNQNQQHLDIYTSSKSISNTFAPPKDDILTPVTGKEMDKHEHIEKIYQKWKRSFLA